MYICDVYYAPFLSTLDGYYSSFSWICVRGILVPLGTALSLFWSLACHVINFIYMLLCSPCSVTLWSIWGFVHSFGFWCLEHPSLFLFRCYYYYYYYYVPLVKYNRLSFPRYSCLTLLYIIIIMDMDLDSNPYIIIIIIIIIYLGHCETTSA